MAENATCHLTLQQVIIFLVGGGFEILNTKY